MSDITNNEENEVEVTTEAAPEVEVAEVEAAAISVPSTPRATGASRS